MQNIIKLFTLVLLFMGISVASAQYYPTKKTAPLRAATTRNEIEDRAALSSYCQKYITACIDDTCTRQTKREKEELDPSLNIYDKCGRYSLNKFSEKITECLKRYQSRIYDFPVMCRTHIMPEIMTFLENKKNLSKTYNNSTKDCINAKKSMSVAKKCYTLMIQKDGEFSEQMMTEINGTCGSAVDGGHNYMARSFFDVGILESSNVGRNNDHIMAGTFPKRTDNWRQIVEGILASYMEKAQTACGEEDFKMTAVNIYKPDSNNAKIYTGNSDLLGDLAKQQNIVNPAVQKCTNRNMSIPVKNGQWYFNQNYKTCMIQCSAGMNFIGNECR